MYILLFASFESLVKGKMYPNSKPHIFRSEWTKKDTTATDLPKNAEPGPPAVAEEAEDRGVHRLVEGEAEAVRSAEAQLRGEAEEGEGVRPGTNSNPRGSFPFPIPFPLSFFGGYF